MFRACLNCGMQVDDFLRRCPKCDNHLDKQTDGSTITVDIAHHGERVRDALQKLDRELASTKAGIAQYLRVIVGTGTIREEVMYHLTAAEHRKSIKSFDLERENAGAILIRLK